jgi:metal-responsive CopG/Arc/MetJ family transcriptional regulator
MGKEKEKFRNVTFNVSESLIEEIDIFCKERGGVKRKQWLFNLMSEKNILENKFQEIQSDYTDLFKENERLKQKIEEKQLAYSNLFTSTLRYRTFYRRLKNLFNKF